MSIKIYPNSKIYVAAPANDATGGPELLHQLAYHLRKNLGINTFMYYFPSNYYDPVHENYKEYRNPYVRKIEDREENLFIVPEVIGGLKLLSDYKNITKIIWWLSVDNYYLSIFSSRNLFLYRATNKILKLLNLPSVFDVSKIMERKIKKAGVNIINPDTINSDTFVKQAKYHLVQSYYAQRHLNEAGFNPNNIFYLSDYLNNKFLNTKVDLSQKENIVVYNPKKGFSFTMKIIKYAPGIKFVPIINMTREEVIKTLQKAKVYIDFGNHPGKDRIPREAAILGCCVITSKKGGAKYFEDVPIPESYKFSDIEKNIPYIISKIKDCFENFEERKKDFDNYRNIIRQEPVRFISDMKKIFRKV